MNCWLSVLLQSSLSPPRFRELLVIPRYISPLPILSQERRSRPSTILPRLATLGAYYDRTFTPSLFGAFVRLQYNPREVRCFNHDSQAIPRIKGANSSAKPLDSINYSNLISSSIVTRPSSGLHCSESSWGTLLSSIGSFYSQELT